MTDPVDTNALREVAAHAREESLFFQSQGDALSLDSASVSALTARHLFAAADEIEQLRAELRAKHSVIQQHTAGIAPLSGMQPAKVQIRPNIRVNIDTPPPWGA